MTANSGDAIARTARQAGGAMGYGVALKAVKFVLAILSSVFIARILQPAEYGIYVWLRMVLALVGGVASVGMAQAILRFLPEVKVGNDPSAMRRLLWWAMGLQLGGWAVCVGLTILLRPFLTGLLTEAIYLVVLLGLYLLIAELLFQITTQIYHALMQMRLYAVISVVSHVVLLGALWILLHPTEPGGFARGDGTRLVLWAAAISNVTGFLLLAVALRGRLALTHDSDTPRMGASRLFRYSLPFAAIGVLQLVVWRQSETLLLPIFWTSKEAGFFDLAYKLPQQALEFVPTAIWPLIMASYATIFALDRSRAERLVEHYYKLLFGLVAPISIAGLVLGDRMLIVLYGDLYREAGDLCRVFFVVQSMAFFGTPLSMTLYVMEKTWVNLLVFLGGAAVKVGLNLWWIPIDWRIGSVLPVSIVVIVTPIVLWLILRRYAFTVRFPWAFLGRAYLGSCAVFLLWPLRSWISGPKELLVSVALAGLLILGGMKLIRLFRAEDLPLLDLLPSRQLRRGLGWFGRRGS